MAELALHEVCADYGETRVLGPVSLTLTPGEPVALVGRSGAGKSTLLGVMYQHWRERAALIPQQLGLVDSLSVFHNVYMGRLSSHSTWYNRRNRAWPARAERDAVRAILAGLELDGTQRQRVGELSGGQRQRVAAGRALYQGAELLLADEPVSALDGPLADRALAELVRRYPTSVLAMHDVELALRHTKRVIGIRDGLIAVDERSERLSARDLLPLYAAPPGEADDGEAPVPGALGMPA